MKKRRENTRPHRLGEDRQTDTHTQTGMTHRLHLGVDLLHLKHHVVRHAGLGEQHVQLTGHAAGDRVPEARSGARKKTQTHTRCNNRDDE